MVSTQAVHRQCTASTESDEFKEAQTDYYVPHYLVKELMILKHLDINKAKLLAAHCMQIIMFVKTGAWQRFESVVKLHPSASCVLYANVLLITRMSKRSKYLNSPPPMSDATLERASYLIYMRITCDNKKTCRCRYAAPPAILTWSKVVLNAE